MYLAGGAYLGKLAAKGWIKRKTEHIAGVGFRDYGYALTNKGRELLKEYNFNQGA